MTDATEPATKKPKVADGADAVASASGMSLYGKKALVTGGSKGIGLTTARLFVELGADVTITARGMEDLKKARDSMPCPERCHIVSADLSTREGIDNLVKGYPHEELHVLVNNVGTNIRKKAESFSPDEFEAIFNSNFHSTYRISLGFLPHLQRAGKASGAAVVNISSVAGSTHIPSGCAYGASKAAMDQLTRNLAVEWSRFGIRVNAVGPGPIETPLIRTASPIYLEGFKKRIPLRRMGDPIEVARPVAFLASEAAAYITGQCLMVHGGFTATSYNEVPGFWEDA